MEIIEMNEYRKEPKTIRSCDLGMGETDKSNGEKMK